MPPIQSHPLQHRPLGRARRAIHLRPKVPAQLHRSHPNATSRRVHQNPLARLDLSELLQRIQGRQIGKRHRGCCLKRHSRRDLRNQLRQRHRPCAKAPEPKSKHAIANRNRPHIRADRFHNTGKLEPDAR